MFSFLSEYSENSLGTVVICMYQSGLKQLILDQTEQNGYQTVPFSVHIHNLMFISFLSEYSENSLGTVVILLFWC